jgi:hypothetical protein
MLITLKGTWNREARYCWSLLLLWQETHLTGKKKIIAEEKVKDRAIVKDRLFF